MILIRGDILLTMDQNKPIIKNGAVAINGSKIIDVGSYKTLRSKYQNAIEHGSPNHWILPGFVNAHNHSGLVAWHFKRGVKDQPLERWLAQLFNSCLLENQIHVSYLNTLFQSYQLIRSGVTCSSDFYYGDDKEPYLGTEHGLRAHFKTGLRVVFFVVAIDKSAVDNGDLEHYTHLMPNELAEKVEKIGVKAHGSTQSNFEHTWKRIFRDFNGAEQRITIGIAPDGPTRCSTELLQKIKHLADEYEAQIQMHLLETKYQKLYWNQKYGESPVRSLYKSGFLGPEVSLAHSIWLTDEDIGLLSETKASVVHNPSANMRLFSGIAPLHRMMEQNVNIAIGTDGIGFSGDNDIIEEMRLAGLLQSVPGIKAERISGKKMLEMVTLGGGKALGLDQEIGSLQPGKKADLITVRADRMLSPYTSPLHDPHDIFCTCARREDISDVYVNGDLVMNNGQVTTTIDIEDIANRLDDWFRRIWKERGSREQEIINTLEETQEHIEKFFDDLDDDSQKSTYKYNAL